MANVIIECDNCLARVHLPIEDVLLRRPIPEGSLFAWQIAVTCPWCGVRLTKNLHNNVLVDALVKVGVTVVETPEEYFQAQNMSSRLPALNNAEIENFIAQLNSNA